jgi:hypothetical protein
MSKTKGRVEIPDNVEELLTLGAKVYKKHLDDGANSKLNLLEDYNWNVVGPTIALCLASHNLAEEYKAKMEEEYRKRDLLLPEIDATLRSSKTLLKGIYAKNPKKLGVYGFSVDDITSPKK